MEKIKSFFQKLIPASITVRSLYWTNYVNEMNKELGVIFDLIDKDEYTKARMLLDEFDNTYSQSDVPRWVAMEMAKMYKANAMLGLFWMKIRTDKIIFGMGIDID